MLLEVLAGHDPLDSTSIDRPVPRYSETIGEPLAGLRLGLVREHFGEGLDQQVEAAVREAVRVYESLGATIKHVSLPHSRYAVATYYIIAPCEASGNLARYDGVRYGHRVGVGTGDSGKADTPHLCARLPTPDSRLPPFSATDAPDPDSPLLRMYRDSRSEGFGREVKRRIMLGTYALSAGYRDAYYKRR